MTDANDSSDEVAEPASPESSDAPVEDSESTDVPASEGSEMQEVVAERDKYIDTSRRLQAEFENYRKQVSKREQEARERSNERLVLELLPVMDACDAAMETNAAEVEPISTALFTTLTKQGLEKVDPIDSEFNPEHHEAVMHEADPDSSGTQTVIEVLRPGYLWKGRVIRPAMVRVKG